MTPQVKICCIKNIEEAQMAIHYGASAIGLVSAMPSGPGIISEETIVQIAASVPSTVATFLLTSQQSAQDIIYQHQQCQTTAIQVVDYLSPKEHKQLKKALPDVTIVQVIHVSDTASISQALHIAPHVDRLLLDSGNPSLDVKVLGGTGRVHNWNLSRKIVELVNIPVYLAGGLYPGNVQKAIHQVNPYGLDVCSGLRTRGLLDEIKVAEFFNQIQTVQA